MKLNVKRTDRHIFFFWFQVHRVIVNMITDYFSNLEKSYGVTDGVLLLPEDMDYNVMLTIVK